MVAAEVRPPGKKVPGNAYGTHAGWNYQSPNQGAYWDFSKSKQFVFAASMPEYQQMVTFLNGWYNKGLIDPESFTQSDDIALQKFTSGKSFAIMENAQYVATDQKALPSGATVTKIPVPIGPTGNTVVGTRLDAGLMISSKAAINPNFVAMMQFIDWLWYSDAGMLSARWGVPGLTYTGSVADGTFQLEPNVDWDGLHPKAKTEINVAYGFYNGVFSVGGSTQLLDTQFPPNELAFQKIMDTRTPQLANVMIITSLFAFRAVDVGRLAAYFLGRTPLVTLGNAGVLLAAVIVTAYATEAGTALLATVLCRVLLHTSRALIDQVRSDFTA